MVLPYFFWLRQVGAQLGFDGADRVHHLALLLLRRLQLLPPVARNVFDLGPMQ